MLRILTHARHTRWRFALGGAKSQTWLPWKQRQNIKGSKRRGCVIVSMNTTSLKCGDVVCTSSWMLWIRCIQRIQVLLVIHSAACVNHLLFAEQSHRWRLKWQDFDWLDGWLCVRVWHECEKNFSILQIMLSKPRLCLMLRFLVAALIWVLWLRKTQLTAIGWPGLEQYESELFKNRIVLYTAELILSTKLLIEMFHVEGFFFYLSVLTKKRWKIILVFNHKTNYILFITIQVCSTVVRSFSVFKRSLFLLHLFDQIQ